MWSALARRDIGEVYRLLCAHGLTQADIAARTRQSQSEVSTIMAGRQVMAYDLLERIADGLGIPRGHLGLAYDPADTTADDVARDEESERVRCLAHAAKVTLGRPAFGEPVEPVWAVEATPTPRRVGLPDVAQVKRMTAELAALERRYGGGMVLPTITAQVRWSHALLGATATDEVSRQLRVAVSLLHQRASCAAFDAGRLDTARHHVLRALELARDAGQAELQACMFYTAGRMELYHGPPDTALRLFQFGCPAALASGLPRLRALLEINEARAYAAMGVARQAKSVMAAAIASFHEDEVHPEWLAFFDVAEVFGAAGLVWVGLGDEQLAITALRKSVAARHPHAVLYRAFDTVELAACHLRNGDLDTGLRLARDVIDVIEGLHSRRARSRLTPLRVAADAGGRTTRSLYERVVELQRG